MIAAQQIETTSRSDGHSTGPKTEEGKQRSRMNALKHGLAGDARMLAEMNREAFEYRLEAWRETYVLETEHDEWIYEQLVAESLRLDRCRQHVEQTTMEYARRAFQIWEEDQRADAEQLASGISKSPNVVASRLQTTHHGCEVMAELWEGLARIIRRKGDWDDSHKKLALDLLGVIPCLREGYALLEFGKPDADHKLAGDRERLASAEIAKLRNLIATAHANLGNSERDNARQGLFEKVPKPLATAYRYEKECDRRFLRYDGMLRKRRRNGVDESTPPATVPTSVPAAKPARAATPKRETPKQSAPARPEPDRRAPSSEASLPAPAPAVPARRTPTRDEIAQINEQMIREGLIAKRLSRDEYKRIIEERLEILHARKDAMNKELVPQRC